VKKQKDTTLGELYAEWSRLTNEPVTNRAALEAIECKVGRRLCSQYALCNCDNGPLPDHLPTCTAMKTSAREELSFDTKLTAVSE
jgi:hypothetical protein